MNLSKELKTTAEGHVNEWTFLFGRCDLCTDGARAMVGRFARPYEASCMLHMEALASKELSQELASMTQHVVKIVNSIKARTKASHFLQVRCEKMGSEHRPCAPTRGGVSHGKVLARVSELWKEASIFLAEDMGLGEPFKDGSSLSLPLCVACLSSSVEWVGSNVASVGKVGCVR